MWEGGDGFTLAGSLVTLIAQLEAAYPDQGWQNDSGTGTIGDAAHRAEGSASDHNPWLNNTVRALDVALTAAGPSCEGLFQMVNRMYAAHDPRVFPNGYAIFNGRITDWSNPGGYHAQQGDQHLTHCHISVSQDSGAEGYNSTAPWPITGSPAPAPTPTPGTLEDDDMTFEMIANITDPTGAVYAWSVSGAWWHVPSQGWVDVCNSLPACQPKGVRRLNAAQFDVCGAISASARAKG